jgi:1-deoxy-D-xylulose-5-phosphate synthase
MRFAKPLDETLLHSIFEKYSQIVTLEDSALKGGFGSAIAEFAIDNQYTKPIIRLGIPDEIIEHGEQSELYKICGIDAESIVNKIVLFKENIRTFAP